MFHFPCFQLHFQSLKGHGYGKKIRGVEKFHAIAFGLTTKLLWSIENFVISCKDFALFNQMQNWW